MGLGYKNPHAAITKHCIEEDIKWIDSKTNRGNQQKKFINENNVRCLISRSKLPTSVYFAKKMGIEIITPRKEHRWISLLANSFSHLDPIMQKKVGNYFIDLYLEKVNIAIECDEFGHKDYDDSKETQRESYIRNKLGCRFVRFNPDDQHFEVGIVINEIIRSVYC